MLGRSIRGSRIRYGALSWLALLHLSCVAAQTGPGGVGRSDGTSALEFWYVATGADFLDGERVNALPDRSGNGWDLFASGTERPRFELANTGANQQSTLAFFANEELESAYQGNSNETMTFGIVLSYVPNPGLKIAIQHGGRNTISVDPNGFYRDYIGGSNHVSTSAPATAGFSLVTRRISNSGADRLRYYTNGILTDVFTHTIENRVSNTWIGGHGDGGGTGYSGSIAEVYKFSRLINEAERIIIANYLSAKYAITLDDYDLYVGDEISRGNYDFDVAGIGRIDAATLQQDARGTGIVRFRNPTDLDDGEFLFWGHDGADPGAYETADVPAGVEARMVRTWRISERDLSNAPTDVGNLDMEWDLSGLGPVTAGDLLLLIDTDNDGNFSDEVGIAGAVALGGNTYAFFDVDGGATGLSDDRRFTLATVDRVQTPLPVVLTSFRADAIAKGEVELTWETASEPEHRKFVLERALKARDWLPIYEVLAAGSIMTGARYRYLDPDVAPGPAYYRLRQVDFDGTVTYSEVVAIDTPTSALVVAPNPVHDWLTVFCSRADLGAITLSDAFGRVVRRLPEPTATDPPLLHLDLSDLPGGIYYFRSRAGNVRVVKH
ncbi:hypothetical protein CLV84_3866 [Neolewinella xylanilytica]|uniref:DUF8202 domain-containing protein n=2 Tax=Neolewinella xylanilytica TaxID=1514080 RepID=A0A2S6I162_9BACT|nr:hypothetical protein CLV84_3866 [Neolewinella xylanilytica]